MVQPSQSLQKGIWIASYPKSGNTWTRAFIHNLLREIRGNTGDAQDINRLSKHTIWEINAGPYQQLLGRHPMECSEQEIAKTRPQVQRLLSEARSRPFFIKTHLSVAKSEGFPTINFDMTLAAIYIVRNPLDVAVSYAHHSGYDVAKIIEQMADPGMKSHGSERYVYEFMGSWSLHVASWMSVWQRPVFVMRYEDMLESPFKVLAGLAGFLRLTPTREQLGTAIEKSSFSELRRQEEENGFAEKPANAEKFFRAGRAGQWRDALTKEQVSQIVKVHAPMMQRGGYMLPNCGGDIMLRSRARTRALMQSAPAASDDRPGRADEPLSSMLSSISAVSDESEQGKGELH